MTHKEFRRSRRRRRRSRYERESRTLWMYATVTIMSLASFLISMAKTVFRFSEDLLGPLSFFLMSCGLMAFGLVMLWGLYQKGNRWTTGALAIGALVVVVGGIHLGDDETTKSKWVNPDNPWESELPTVRKSSKSGRPDLMLVIGEQNAAFGKYDYILPEDQIANGERLTPFIGEHGEDFRPVVRDEVSMMRWLNARIPSNFGSPPEGESAAITVRINADRCYDFARFYSYQRVLAESELVIELGVIAPEGVSFLVLHFADEIGNLGAPEVTLMPDHIAIQKPGEPAASVVECHSKNCFSVSGCKEAQDFVRVVEVLQNLDPETFVLRVHPQVSMQSMVGLIDALMTGPDLYPFATGPQLDE